MQKQQPGSIYDGSASPRLPRLYVRFIQQARALLLVLIALMLLSGAARAQSAIDGFAPNVNDNVDAMAIQPDGKIVIGGHFTAVNGQPRTQLARLNADGSLDMGFNVSVNGFVFALTVQPDGKILAGGSFTMLDGQTHNNIARINANGTGDGGFSAGTDGTVFDIDVQGDNKILVGGSFNTMGGQVRNRIGRLNADGTIDAGFNPGASNIVYSIAWQTDGKVVVGGGFSTLGGQTRNYIGRVNADGSLDIGFNPGANNVVNALAVQADGKVAVGGDFTVLGGQTRNHVGRLNTNGSIDAGFNPNADNSVYGLRLQPDGKLIVGGIFATIGGQSRNHIARLDVNGVPDNLNPGANLFVGDIVVQQDGKIVASGAFTTFGSQTRNRVARLNIDGSLDNDFNTPVSSGFVFALATQPDGKILIGGSFTKLFNVFSFDRLARLRADGNIDATFNPGANGPIYAFAVQPDGKILVAGGFTALGGFTRTGLTRLNADGSVDTSFFPGANNYVDAIVLQPDGKIIAGGGFTSMNGQTRNHIARINPDGTLDSSFNPGASSDVYALALQLDGKILVGGNFTVLDGQARSRIGRLNANGSVDAGFTPGADATVQTIVVQSDQKILVGGSFGNLGFGSHNGIGRLNANGTHDGSFNPSANGTVYTIGLQADGKIVLGGQFTAMLGQPRNHIARLSAAGVLDAAFNPGASSDVDALAVQQDGKILVAGEFATFDGQARSGFARLSSPSAALSDITVNNAGTSVTWTRSGSGPDLARVSFESSVDGVNYTPLGEAVHSGQVWSLASLALPTGQNFFVRARGFFGTGYGNGADSMIETVALAYVSSCGFSLAPTSQNFSAAGGSGNVALTASAANCAWTVQSNAAWITPAIFSGTGSASVGYVVAANPGAQRTGTMTIGGQTFTVTQAAFSCSYNVTPQTFNLSAGAGGGIMAIATTVGCAWTATSNAAWLTVTTPNGNGNGTAGFTMAANPNAAPRTGTLTVAGQTITVTQDGTASAITGLQFYPLPRPVRILDTRAGQGNCDNISTPINGGSSLSTFARLTCEGITIPANAQAVVGNVTVLNKTAQNGYMTIYPDGQNAPLAASMIYGPNGILSNNFTVGLSANGNFNIFGERTIDAVVDISGYYAPPAAGGLYYHPLSKPIRLLDTRAGQGNCDNVNAPIAAGASITTLARKTCEGLTIPQAAQAIVGVATVINGSGQIGYLTIYPNGVQAPLAANMVYFPGQILSNAFTVSLSTGGEFNIFGERTIDMGIDVAGYYSTEANDVNGVGLLFTPLSTPVRLLDTRAGQGNCDSVNAPINAGSSLSKLARMSCEGQLIPNTAQAIIGNVTVVNLTAQAGYLTLYPTGQAAPLAANLIYEPGQILSNAFVVGLNGSGQFSIFAERTLDAIVDVSGFFAP